MLKQTLKNTFSRGPPYNTKKKKRQNRPLELRLSGAPLYCLEKKTIKQSLRNTVVWVPLIMPIKKKTKKNVKIDPQKYVYHGSPLYPYIKKNPNRPSEICLSGPLMPIFQQIRQNTPSEIRLSGVPPIMLIKKQNKKIVKIDPQKYLYQGSPLYPYI